MQIVAEGVESEAEASVMRLVDLTELQDIYFSQGVPADEIAALLALANYVTAATLFVQRTM